MNGILVINKQSGCTSRDIVNDVCHMFNTKSVGHTGTLDPIAHGVLVLTIGKYTKLGDVLTSTYKEYIAEMKLGIETDTIDTEGKVLKEENVDISEEEIKSCLESFVGTYEQEVPIYSAVKVNGKKLYEYARNGETVELPKREVEIKEIELLSYQDNIVKFRCLVSKGTYIRSLIRDIAESLNTVAIMTDLERTKQGVFDINNSYTVDDVKNNNYKLLDVDDVLDIEIVETDDELYKQVSNGVKLDSTYNKEFILFKHNGNNVSLYRKKEDKYCMFIYLDK